jgi:hypothetical protein
LLSLVGWLDRLTALIVFLIGVIIGLLSIYKSIKMEAKLLRVTGFATLCAGFTLLGPTVDFLTILVTGDNIEPYCLYGLLSYVWSAPLTIFGLYFGAELIIPDKKKIIVSIYAVLSIIFEIFLFYYTFTNPSFIYVFPPDPHGNALLNTSLVITTPVFIILLIFLISGLIFNGLGFLNKSIQSSGEIKRKFFYLSLGWILFIICGAFYRFI